jgi:hypothetical protein
MKINKQKARELTPSLAEQKHRVLFSLTKMIKLRELFFLTAMII